jgi:hypothetical protein
VNYVGDISGSCSSPSTVLAFLTKISDRSKHVSTGAVQMKNLQGTVTVEEKLDAISRTAKG